MYGGFAILFSRFVVETQSVFLVWVRVSRASFPREEVRIDANHFESSVETQ